ncbi:MAG TPA: tetratricopeptide repeat protein, partial [Thermoanaerobaculia bacterium]|nr:tetratricopeptide repeat protein [Thermoanaerobaculia bacterium]
LAAVRSPSDVGARRELARCLLNLGNRLAEGGRFKEAHRVLRRALRRLQNLAREHPERFQVEISSALQNLGAVLIQLGRIDEALSCLAPAAASRRWLVAQFPLAHRSDLAQTLSTLASLFQNLGWAEQALRASGEAVELYRLASEARPRAVPRALLASLEEHANLLRAAGDAGAALEMQREAVELCRQEVGGGALLTSADLARNLVNLGNDAFEDGDAARALEAVSEAVELYRQLEIEQPGGFPAQLASALHNQATYLSARLEGAAADSDAAALVKLATEAVTRFRALEPQGPQALSGLASSLESLGIGLLASGDPEQARAAFGEALELLEACGLVGVEIEEWRSRVLNRFESCRGSGALSPST